MSFRTCVLEQNQAKEGGIKYRSSKTVVWGVLAWIAACDFIGAFFRHFHCKVNIKISRTEPKIERLLRLFFFFFQWNQFHVYSIPLVSPAIAVYKQCVFGFSSNSLSTPYIFWTLNGSQNIVKSKGVKVSTLIFVRYLYWYMSLTWTGCTFFLQQIGEEIFLETF